MGSSLISIDSDPGVLDVAREFLGADSRLRLIEWDAGDFIREALPASFDFIFADAWVGK